ncbi:hypothetical protein QR680_017837 [Steinernema hermaphroditum]|uniref:Protein kinase domain-containing protein n=1 Tax=Steinernema hermaphroditum TaxID=289476 RepID=A0AA39HG06_9BILA|nr:hypothetical protein QR680_017837 [Steinernema hermaphroditum]
MDANFGITTVVQELCSTLSLTSDAKKIAKTCHSTVYRAHSAKFNCEVAIKVIDRSLIPLHIAKTYLPRELKITRRVHHPHLLRSLLITHIRQFTVIVTEFCSRGSLISVLNNIGRFDEREACRLFGQLLEGVKYMHDHLLAHRDIKLENILLNEANDVRLIDYGFAVRMEHPRQRTMSGCGSRPYTALSIVQKRPYNPFSTDFYSCGFVLYTMLTGKWPTDAEERYRKGGVDVDYPSPPSEEAKELITRLLTLDDEERPGYEEIVGNRS